ncbi:MAG TPA: alternative ribosome rescue aminoacyl-tRNA hydrolase ArfB [Actinomycetota bacterium]|nr:alternative ribosome rescue aminoacyl-tRNA hydrolase ArfB [Actinomycetota bacterium]
MGGIRINRSLTIPEHEIEYGFSPSGGPGGQHANKASTRVELVWDIGASAALGPRQRQRLLGALRHRIDSSGRLRMTSDRHRSQLQNRKDVSERFAALVAEALVPPKARVGTKPTRASTERRLRQKKRRGEIKRKRSVGPDDF